MVITDKILVKPHAPLHINNQNFKGGYVLCQVEIFDLNNQKNYGTFDIAAKNSNSIKFDTDMSYSYSNSGGVSYSGVGFIKYGDSTLLDNLYENMKKNAMKYAGKKVD